MKKTKALALTLAAATMMMGAGYAYWTDTLTINNTVSTGEFNVSAISAALSNQEVAGTKYVRVTTPVVEENSATFVASNLYPGASLNFDAVFKNTGTIPAVIDSIQLTSTGTQGLDRSAFLVKGTLKAEGVGTFNVNTTLDQLERAVVAQTKGVRLEPNKEIILDLNIELKPSLVLDQQENMTLSEVFTINFVQHNAQ